MLKTQKTNLPQAASEAEPTPQDSRNALRPRYGEIKQQLSTLKGLRFFGLTVLKTRFSGLEVFHG
jgi:hypothetical protein